MNRQIEEWRPIEGYPGYFVSNLGRVKREVLVSNVLTPSPRNRHLPYLAVKLCRDGKPTTQNVHSLVARAFHGPAPSPQHEVAHGPAGPTENNASNLRWATPRENQNDRVAAGTHNRGERATHVRLTADQVIEIRSQLAAGASQHPLARAFGVSREAIADIKQRRSWGWL